MTDTEGNGCLCNCNESSLAGMQKQKQNRAHSPDPRWLGTCVEVGGKKNKAWRSSEVQDFAVTAVAVAAVRGM